MTHEQRKDIAEFIRNNPDVTYCQIAQLTQLGYSTITLIAQQFGIRRTTGRKSNQSTSVR